MVKNSIRNEYKMLTTPSSVKNQITSKLYFWLMISRIMVTWKTPYYTTLSKLKAELRNHKGAGWLLTFYSVAVSDARVDGAADEGELCLV